MLPKGGIFGSDEAWKKHVAGLSPEAKEELRKNNKWLLEQLYDPKNKVKAETKVIKAEYTQEMADDFAKLIDTENDWYTKLGEMNNNLDDEDFKNLDIDSIDFSTDFNTQNIFGFTDEERESLKLKNERR